MSIIMSDPVPICIQDLANIFMISYLNEYNDLSQFDYSIDVNQLLELLDINIEIEV